MSRIGSTASAWVRQRQVARPTYRTRDRIGELGASALLFILPFMRLIEVHIGVGVLFMHDILTFPVLAFLLMRPERAALLRPLRICMILIGVWFASAILTDFLRSVPFGDLARGWSRIVLLGGNIMMIWLLSKGRLQKLTIYVVGMGLSLILNPFINPTELSGTDPWKFGVGYGVALIVAGMMNFPEIRRRLPTVAGAIGLAAVAGMSLILNARSAFAITGLAAVYALFAGYIARHPRLAGRINPAIFLLMILSGVLASNLLLLGYGELAAQGTLGVAAREKYYMQSGGGGVGLLLGGRPESLVSIQAILDSPVLGHGSWAKDPYYTHLFQARLRAAGLLVPDDYRDIGKMTEFLIPTHSHLLGSWVEAGLLSVPFWSWTIFLAFFALYSAIRVHWQPNVLVALISLSMLWDVLFSPFASDARILKAIEICVLVCAVNMLRIPARLASQYEQQQQRRARKRGAIGSIAR